jgi:hypothetical protein
MKHIKTTTIFLMLLFLVLFMSSSCKKFLDAKPAGGLNIPNALPELQGLLDRFQLYINDPGVAEVCADDYYVTYPDWNSQNEQLRRMYTWEEDGIFNNPASEWRISYEGVYTANTVLEGLTKIERNVVNGPAWDNAKGQALFLRGRNFMNIATIWALAYDKVTADNDLGIPLRLNTDFTEISTRSSVEQSYQQIVKDLSLAIPLLPTTQVHVFRPTRAAAAGLLARVYLSMRQYDSCYKYADLSLQLKSTLLNFNGSPDINPSAAFPIKEYNSEISFHSMHNTVAILLNSRAKVDSLLYQSYALNDLRRTLFFRSNNNGTFGFKGSFSGNGGVFTGVSVNEVYLMRAECHARLGRTNDAMNDLNTLLITRWKTGTFIPFTASDPATAVQLIVTERRKELLMRGLRWMDIKRLNKEGKNISLKRILNGVTFDLPANDLRFALPIPEDIISLTGMPQNPR